MNFSVEEENLICMYHTSDRRRTMVRMLAAPGRAMTGSGDNDTPVQSQLGTQ